MKFGTNCLLDFTGATQDVCFTALIFYAFIWNHTVDPALVDENHFPYIIATSCSDNISALCAFRFWEPVYCLVDPEEQSFPSQSKVVRAWWIGILENVGAPMTWKVLTNKTKKVLFCSEICSTLDPSMRNLSLDPLSSTDFKLSDSKPSQSFKYPTDTSPPNITLPPEPDATDSPEVIFFRPYGERTSSNAPGVTTQKFKSIMKNKNRNNCKDADGNLMYQLSPYPDELPGRYLHTLHPETSLPTHVTIGKLINAYDNTLQKHLDRQAHFEIKYTKDDKDNILSYNDIVNYLNDDVTLYDSQLWQFWKIIAHK